MMGEGPRQQTEKPSQVSVVAIPVLFVLLWASGFVVPRVFGPYVEPITFIGARNGGAALVLVLVALALRCPWPQQRSEQLGLMWAGALLQGFFTMAVYWSIHRGLPVGIAALAGGLQPALTAMFAAWIVSERVSALQWIGIVLGFVGLVLVMTPKLGAGHAAASARPYGARARRRCLHFLCVDLSEAF
jgi:drug/metabolite transporter (DMT)-like permease